MDKRYPFQVMAKPIGPRCNLHCTYCYYLEKERLYPDAKKFAMAPEVLEVFVRDYIAHHVGLGAPEIVFNWQGGEPTLLGIDFFRTALALQARYAPATLKVSNSIQTNGLLLDAAWAEFLKANDFLVGLSIDGPPDLHDCYRHDHADRPSHAKVLAALDLLRRHEVEFNTLTVVHRDNAKEPRAVYRFLKEAGVRFMQFIPLVERTPDGITLNGVPGDSDVATSVTPWSVRPKDYGDFLCGVFDEWIYADVGTIFVQLFDIQLGLRLGAPASLCWFAEVCGNGLALEHNGDLYACDHYVYPEYKRGNILDTPIQELAANANQQRFGTDKRDELPRQCRECAIRYACSGGCPKHRFLKTASGEPGLNYFCESIRCFVAHAGSALGVMAELCRRGRPAADIMPRVWADPASVGIASLRRPGRNETCPCGSGKKFKVCCGRKPA